MLLHIYFCDGCFIQMLKDSKNLLKMSLKILFIKKKGISFHSSPSSQTAHGHFFPTAQHRSQRPSPPFPARPSFAPAAQPRAPRRPSRASPAARIVPAQPRRTRQLPRPAADAQAPPVDAVPYPARLGNRPLLALQQPPPRRASWARPPVALGLVKRQPSPPSRAPCCPRSIFASFPAATAARRSSEDCRSPSASPSSPSHRRLHPSPL